MGWKRICISKFKFEVIHLLPGSLKTYMGFNQQRLIWYIFASKVWCKADVSSVRPSSEQTEELWENRCLNIGVLIYADRKVRSCNWLKFVASDWSKKYLKLCE